MTNWSLLNNSFGRPLNSRYKGGGATTVEQSDENKVVKEPQLPDDGSQVATLAAQYTTWIASPKAPLSLFRIHAGLQVRQNAIARPLASASIPMRRARQLGPVP